MTKKKAPPRSGDWPADSVLPPVGDVRHMPDLENAAIADFSAERDEMLTGARPDSLLPETEEAFYARDPFSADYADFLRENRRRRQGGAPRVDVELRADLLAKPYLMKTPEEAGLRGAAAVWRSLRDQLHGESLAVIDNSDREEMLMVVRDLQTRKALVASVAKGIDDLLRRLEQRLAEVDRDIASGGLPKAKD